MAFTIKDHIEKGHYPKDDKGRALVPLHGGNVATIYAVDHDSAYPICGRCPKCGDAETWTEDGQRLEREEVPCPPRDGDLLPPPPRKKKLSVEIEYGQGIEGHKLRSCSVDGAYFPKPGTRVRFTTEYEEPWS